MGGLIAIASNYQYSIVMDKIGWRFSKTAFFEVNNDEIKFPLKDSIPSANAFNKSYEIKDGSKYWVFEVLEMEKSIRFGVVSLKYFHNGWNIRGFFYDSSGYLADGRKSTLEEFGPQVEVGDEIGFLVSIKARKSSKTDKYVTIHLFHNSLPLGMAWKVCGSYHFPLHPGLCFTGIGKVKIREETTIPSELERHKEISEGIEGNWKILSAENNDGSNRLKGSFNDYTLEIRKRNSEDYRFVFRLKNRLMGEIIADASDEQGDVAYKVNGDKMDIIMSNREKRVSKDLFRLYVMLRFEPDVTVIGNKLLFRTKDFCIALERYSKKIPLPLSCFPNDAFCNII